MCSTWEERLARLRAAIDEVALAAHADLGGHADPEELTARVAGLWAMIAELDPGLAARLRGYCPDTSLEHPAIGQARLAAPRLPPAAFSSVNSLSEAASLLGPCQGLPGTAAHYSSAPIAGHSSAPGPAPPAAPGSGAARAAGSEPAMERGTGR